MLYKLISRPVLVASLLASNSGWVNAQDAITDLTDALPNAKPGQCFAKVLIPAEYQTISEKVISKEASTKIDIIPAKYQMIEERVETKPASEKIVEVPATFKKLDEKILISAESLVWRRGSEKKAKIAPPSWVASAISSGVSSTAESGQCFFEYHQPATYKSVEEKIIKREASAKFEVIPAAYKWEEQKVLIKEASEKIIDTPASYETLEEKILERAAYTTWKKGRGPIEKLSNSTGDIMCLVEVPAKYRTITKKILKTAASSKRIVILAEYKTVKVRKLVTAAQQKRIEIPAEFQSISKQVKVADEYLGWRLEGAKGLGKTTGKVVCRAKITAKYRTISKQVIATPATTKRIIIPAENKLVKVRKLLTPAQENTIAIPATYAQISKRKKISDEKLVWRQILCETNTSKEIVTKLQKALSEAGFNPGPVDGKMGTQTYVAIDNFQKKNGIESGGLTLRTLEALNVSLN